MLKLLMNKFKIKKNIIINYSEMVKIFNKNYKLRILICKINRWKKYLKKRRNKKILITYNNFLNLVEKFAVKIICQNFFET